MAELEVAAVLCDMDGTLVDSTAMVDQMWTEFAQALGLDREQVLAFAHGRPSRATIARYVNDATEAEDWRRRIHAMEDERFDQVTEVPGAAAFVAALPADRWALVTSALSGPARDRLGAVGIVPPRVLIGADDVEHGKPHPEGYARAARELGAEPKDCVVFEDTVAGIEAGLAAGCKVVAVGDASGASLSGVPRVRDMTEVAVRVRDEALVLTIPG